MARIPSRAHRRRHGPKAPTAVAMSYQILWRKWLTKVWDQALPHLLATYRHKMGRRVDAKYKHGFTHETYVKSVDPEKLARAIEHHRAKFGVDPSIPGPGQSLTPHKSEAAAIKTALEINAPGQSKEALIVEHYYGKGNQPLEVGVREILPGSPHAIESTSKVKVKNLAASEAGESFHPERGHLGIVTQEVFTDPALTKDIRVVAARVNKQNAIDFRRVVGINPHTEQGLDAAIETFRDRNVALFKSLAGEELDRMKDVLDEAERGAWRVEDLSEKLQEEFEVTKSKGNFWARDQVLKLNGQLTQQRQTNAGITSYIWTTSGDERVREAHAELDGTKQEWSDPPVISEDGTTGNPGDDYQCRCTAFPVLDELEDNE